jgi:FkbM family methyltransferase
MNVASHVLSVGSRLLSTFPLRRGRFWIIRRSVTRRLFEATGDSLMAELRNGMRLPVDPRDCGGRQLFLFGLVDPEVVGTCEALLRPGDIFLDVGANYGSVGLLCAQATVPGGEVHFFEPQRPLCDQLARTIAHYDLVNCHVHPFGLLDRDALLCLQIPPGNHGRASLVRNISGQEPEGMRRTLVPVRDVSTILDAFPPERRIGVKLDVEGAERILLPRILERRSVAFVVFEFHSGNVYDQNDHGTVLWDAIVRSGRALFGISPRRPRPVLHAVFTKGEMQRYRDFVAVPQLRDQPRRLAPTELSQLMEKELHSETSTGFRRRMNTNATTRSAG